MAKKHIKRIAASRTWPILRKSTKFVTHGYPNGQRLDLSLPLNIVLRDVLGLANNAKEVKYIMTFKKVLLNGKRMTNYRKMMGLFDVISFPEIKKSYRMIIDKFDKLNLLEEKINSNIKLSKLTSKKKAKNTKTQKNKIQLGFNDGTTLLVDEKTAKNFKIGDSFVIEFKEGKRVLGKHLPFEIGKVVFIDGGKYVGYVGILKNVVDDIVEVESSDGTTFKTSKEYAFIVGDSLDKPLITLSK